MFVRFILFLYYICIVLTRKKKEKDVHFFQMYISLLFHDYFKSILLKNYGGRGIIFYFVHDCAQFKKRRYILSIMYHQTNTGLFTYHIFKHYKYVCIHIIVLKYSNELCCAYKLFEIITRYLNFFPSPKTI